MPLSIIMYHYVRDLSRSRYPAIKGRDLASFRRQLDHIGQYYTVVTAEQVIQAVRYGERLPDNAAWLTFDDGYIDHYLTVFPLLHERGWEGSFFPPVRTVRDGELLDVNRVHFILAACSDHEAIIAAIRSFVNERQGHEGVRPFDEYWNALAKPFYWDSAEIIFIKRILQHALPEDLRQELAAELFRRIVTVDEAAFAAELYMTPGQLKLMIGCGMYVGSHGAGHYWLDCLEMERQAHEVNRSLEFLGTLGAPTQDWVMSYPYGAYDDSLLGLLKERHCAIGLTTATGVADLVVDHPLTLPRLDTNDLPA